MQTEADREGASKCPYLSCLCLFCAWDIVCDSAVSHDYWETTIILDTCSNQHGLLPDWLVQGSQQFLGTFPPSKRSNVSHTWTPCFVPTLECAVFSALAHTAKSLLCNRWDEKKLRRAKRDSATFLSCHLASHAGPGPSNMDCGDSTHVHQPPSSHLRSAEDSQVFVHSDTVCGKPHSSQGHLTHPVLIPTWLCPIQSTTWPLPEARLICVGRQMTGCDCCSLSLWIKWGSSK